MKLTIKKLVIYLYGICVFLYVLLQTEVSAISPSIDWLIRGLFMFLFIFAFLFKSKLQ